MVIKDGCHDKRETPSSKHLNIMNPVTASKQRCTNKLIINHNLLFLFSSISSIGLSSLVVESKLLMMELMSEKYCVCNYIIFKILFYLGGNNCYISRSEQILINKKYFF